MDRLIIPNDATGFPEVIETWEFMHKLVQDPFAGIGHLVGQNTILKGIERQGVTGAITYTDGFITYQGELMPFVGGDEDNMVSIIIEDENANYNTDVNNDEVFDNLPAYRRKYAVLGEQPGASEVFNFNLLKRHLPLDQHLVSHRRSTIFLGNFSATIGTLSTVIEVVFPEIPASNYLVLATFRLLDGEFISDNDLSWAIRNRTSTGFELVLRSLTTDFEGVFFEYYLVGSSLPVGIQIIEQ